jgi:hypothetical protein
MKSKSLHVKYSERCDEDRPVCDAAPEAGSQARHLITGTPTGKGQDSVGAVEAEQPIEDQTGPLERLVSRYDAAVFDVGRPLVRLRIEIGESVAHDVVIRTVRRGWSRPATAPMRR